MDADTQALLDRTNGWVECNRHARGAANADDIRRLAAKVREQAEENERLRRQRADNDLVHEANMRLWGEDADALEAERAKVHRLTEALRKVGSVEAGSLIYANGHTRKYIREVLAEVDGTEAGT